MSQKIKKIIRVSLHVIKALYDLFDPYLTDTFFRPSHFHINWDKVKIPQIDHQNQNFAFFYHSVHN